MGKSKGNTVQTTGPDAQTQQYAAQVWNAAQGAANLPGAGVDPLTTQAGTGFGRMAAAGNLGFDALSGNPAAVQSMMNPYQSQVLDALHQQYARMGLDTTNALNSQATMAGAFGGSRHGVAQGVALGELGRAEGSQAAQTLSQGYGDAMSRAGMLANLGFGANGALANLGEYQRNVAEQNSLRPYSILAGALGNMPRGSTTTTTETPGHNGATGALGGAATGAEIGSMILPGWGTGIGAGIGGLLGMFG